MLARDRHGDAADRGLSPGEEVGSTPARLGVTHLLYQGAAENTQYQQQDPITPIG